MGLNDPRTEVKELLGAGDLRELLVRTAALHGHYCPGVAYGVKAGYAAVRRLGFDNTGMEELVAVVECNNCFVDGVQMTTGCSLGNNALIYKDLGKTAVTVMSRRTEEAVRVSLRPNRWESEDATEREKEASELFRRVVKEREDDPEATRRMQELWRELSFETVQKPEGELFQIADVPAEFPPYAPIHDSACCAECGEEVMETRAALREGRVVCLDCAGADCMAVTGRGIHALRDGQFC